MTQRSEVELERARNEVRGLRRLLAAKERRIRARERSLAHRLGRAIALVLDAPVRGGRLASAFLSQLRWFVRHRLLRQRRPRSRPAPTLRRRASEPAPTPQPVPPGARPPVVPWVHGNRWTELDPPALGGWQPRLRASVILPYYRAQPALEITLAALARQTYPRRLLQVIVADDGSPEAPAIPAGLDGLEVEVVRQPRRGFGLARARNAGAAAAHGEILLFLDCDMVPEPQWLEAHARWHHLVTDAVTLGFRRHVDFAGIDAAEVAAAAAEGELGRLFAGREQRRPEWIEVHLKRMRELTSGHDDLFRVATGGNLGLKAETFAATGRFDESFDQWGAEDIELGYRLFTHGALLIPERRARCWHQGLGAGGAGEPDPAERRSLVEQRAKIAHLIAHPDFRRQVPGRSFRVPFVAVRVEVADEPQRQVREVVEAILASRFHDLVVCLTVPDEHPDSRWLIRQFDGDPRVRAGAALDDDILFPFAAVRATMPPHLLLSSPALGKLLDRLRRQQAGALEVRLGPTPTGLRLVTTRARRRASRLLGDGESVELAIAELFGAAAVDAAEVGVRLCAGAALPASRAPRAVPSLLRAAAAAETGGEPAASPGGPLFTLPPVDVGIVNPAGFRGADNGRLAAVATGGLDRQGRQRLAELAAGAAVDVFEVPASPGRGAGLVGRAVRRARVRWPLDRGLRLLGPVAAPGELVALLRSYRGVVDDRSLHRDETLRAAWLVRLSAAGVPLRLPTLSSALRGLLGEPLAAALETVSRSALEDPDERERASVRLRRAALGDHSAGARCRQLAAAAGRPPPPPPRVSVLLAVHRPEYLEHALRQVRRQTYEPRELVLAFHGDGFPAGGDFAAGCPLRVIRLGRDRTLGAVLDAASAAATGELLAKMDSDDWYGAEHLFDLVAALEYSGADLAGKGAEFVYLKGRDVTLRRFVVGAETQSLTLGGGALLIRRAALEAAGGWRDVPREVDHGLIRDVLAAGGSVYRTHGFGYLLHRHGEGHTWAQEDDIFLRQAAVQRSGLDLAFAGVE